MIMLGCRECPLYWVCERAHRVAGVLFFEKDSSYESCPLYRDCKYSSYPFLCIKLELEEELENPVARIILKR